MKMGTKSVLFGVHQFIWHPWTVARAWRWLYGRWPNIYEWCAVFCHDIGYIGKDAMDSPEGQTHPEFGAKVAMYLAYGISRARLNSKDDSTVIALRIYRLCLFHSTHYAQKVKAEVSALYLPDKACVLVDPPWFYLLRGKWSGEVFEYTDRENDKNGTSMGITEWLYRYRGIIKGKTNAFFDAQKIKALEKWNTKLHRRIHERKLQFPCGT